MSKESIIKKGKNISKYWKNKTKVISLKQRKQISNTLKGIKNSKKTKQKKRISAIKRIERQKQNGLPLNPCIGKNETRLLNQVEILNSIKLVRQYRVMGYFVDGYDIENNTVYSENEGHHFDSQYNFT